VGGGVTGAGIAVDAATRGLTTAIVEAQDWADGTSSRSSKLVHGGLRYLLMFDFKLVHEALTERDLLLSTTAPHLVQPVPFLYPLTHAVWERPYVATGVGMYDALAHAPGRKRALPMQKHLSKKGLLEVFPDFKPEAAVGAVRYYDAKVDDARLVLTLVRTAALHGAHVASRTQMVAVTTNDHGIVDGADVVDLLSGKEYHVAAKNVIVATGVWTEETEALADPDGGLRVLASKGIHIVVPRDRIDGQMGIISQTEKSVLFIIPWDNYWVIGTTDTPWDEPLRHPVATRTDIDYVIDHANAVLRRPLTRADVMGVYAGLRPLLQPGTKQGTSSAKISREHTVASPAPGMTVIAGGKLTTYRVMAEDAVDFALGADAKSRPCVTASLPLLGANGYQATLARREALATTYGWGPMRVKHMLTRYGSVIEDLTDMIDADPAMGEPVPEAPDYLACEIAYAATSEGAFSLDDVMMTRTRLHYETPDSGLGAASAIAAIMAPILGWDAARTHAEIAAYTERVRAEKAAQEQDTDAHAEEVRLTAKDTTPMRALA
ncbi:MAG: glycerol-3-phosphate dehydrogenase/oxidase, partial [Bifidobacteriaceae bacterium]|nr:glycerol-3-phosphate dehydrogenase/oxidase [Bifidobacteriaceae bacterium]